MSYGVEFTGADALNALTQLFDSGVVRSALVTALAIPIAAAMVIKLSRILSDDGEDK